MELQKVFAEIDLKALSHNLRVAKKKTGDNGILAVVKANAYGHGAVRVSKHLIQDGISMLGVAFTSEAVALRESGIKTPILVFFDRDNIKACLKYNLTPVVFDLNTAKRFSSEAKKLNQRIWQGITRNNPRTMLRYTHHIKTGNVGVCHHILGAEPSRLQG